MILKNRTNYMLLEKPKKWTELSFEFKTDGGYECIILNPKYDLVKKMKNVEVLDDKDCYIFKTYSSEDSETFTGYWLIAMKDKEVYVEYLGTKFRSTISVTQIHNYRIATNQESKGTKEQQVFELIRNKLMQEGSYRIHETSKKSLFEWQRITDRARIDKLDRFRTNFLKEGSKGSYRIHPDLTLENLTAKYRKNPSYELLELELSIRNLNDFMYKLMKLHQTSRTIHLVINDVRNISEMLTTDMNIIDWLNSDKAKFNDTEFENAFDCLEEVLFSVDIETGKPFCKKFNKLTICRLSEFLTKGTKAFYKI